MSEYTISEKNVNNTLAYLEALEKNGAWDKASAVRSALDLLGIEPEKQEYRHGMKWLLPSGEYYTVTIYGDGNCKGTLHKKDGSEYLHSAFDVYRAGGSWRSREFFKTEKGCVAAIERQNPRGHWTW